jgi:DNA-binding transcriptional LysR family regulator
MKLRHIELINAILQTGSLSAAARRLDVTQPSATRTLQQAERGLGYALFTRRGGRLHPTDELQHLAPAVRQVFDSLEDARRTSLNLRSRPESMLRVGIVLSMAQALPEAYVRMAPGSGGLRCEFSTGHYNTLLEWLLVHEIDIAIALEPPLHPALNYIDLGHRHLVCAARPELLGKFRRARSVSAQAMQSMPLIEVVNTDPVGRMVATYAERFAWPFPAQIAVKTHQVALDFADRGLGVAVVDDLSASRYAASLTILPIEPTAAISVQAMTLQSRSRQVTVDRFLEAYRQAIGRDLSA